MKTNPKTVAFVEEGSPAFEAGIAAGDIIVSINGVKIKDMFDYRIQAAEEQLSLVFLRDGNEIEFNVSKDTYDDLGLEFENSLMDEDRPCCNNCVFCFIDQMPPHMRDTLYFKDDDMRLSFLTGNYVTLTNITNDEIKRLAGYHLSPINVSVHTTNPELRCKMVRHKNAGSILEKINLLLQEGISVNGQIVLVPEMNDGDELRRTLTDLMGLGENFESVSVVPVGLTKYRDNLPKLRTFTSDECREIVSIVEDFQKTARESRGTNFVYASDEIYIKAGLPLPDSDSYDDFPQIENGVGMAALLKQDVVDFLEGEASKVKKLSKRLSGNIIIPTGTLIADTMREIVGIIEKKINSCGGRVNIKVVPVVNNFFGQEVTVTGLLTGKDVIEALKPCIMDKKKTSVIISANMLKADEDVFLDNVTLEAFENALGCGVRVTGDSGEALVMNILGK